MFRHTLESAWTALGTSASTDGVMWFGIRIATMALEHAVLWFLVEATLGLFLQDATGWTNKRLARARITAGVHGLVSGVWCILAIQGNPVEHLESLLAHTLMYVLYDSGTAAYLGPLHPTDITAHHMLIVVLFGAILGNLSVWAPIAPVLIQALLVELTNFPLQLRWLLENHVPRAPSWAVGVASVAFVLLFIPLRIVSFSHAIFKLSLFAAETESLVLLSFVLVPAAFALVSLQAVWLVRLLRVAVVG